MNRMRKKDLQFQKLDANETVVVVALSVGWLAGWLAGCKAIDRCCGI
jgi:hypothetical protein